MMDYYVRNEVEHMIQKVNSGIGFLSMLAVLFIGLKLTGYINWSWLWVLSPLWIEFAIFIIFVIVAIAIHVVMDIDK